MVCLGMCGVGSRTEKLVCSPDKRVNKAIRSSQGNRAEIYRTEQDRTKAQTCMKCEAIDNSHFGHQRRISNALDSRKDLLAG